MRYTVKRRGASGAVGLLLAGLLAAEALAAFSDSGVTLGRVFRKDAETKTVSVRSRQMRVETFTVTDRTVIEGGGWNNLGLPEIPIGEDVEVSWQKDFDGRKVAEWIRIRF